MPQIHVSKSYYPTFIFEKTYDPTDKKVWWARGAYINMNGNAVSFYMQPAYGNIGDSTTLFFTHDGKDYRRNYDKTFSEHGLKLICAKLIRDVLNEKEHER